MKKHKMDDWLPEGECPHFTVYQSVEEDEIPVVYDHEGNPFMRKRIKLGFDLSV